MKYLGFTFILFLLVACQTAEKTIVGTYELRDAQRTKLILRQDHTFELSMLNASADSILVKDADMANFFTTGLWEVKKNKLQLKTVQVREWPGRDVIVNDSVTHFTSISSINFWTRHGDPIPIRSIVLPAMRPKPHFGNSLYFFSQDFKSADTLKFNLEGYPTFSFPGSIPSTLGNNAHKIVLHEPYRETPFTNLQLAVKKDQLITYSGKLKFKKK
jgi:hypothetical protein